MNALERLCGIAVIVGMLTFIAGFDPLAMLLVTVLLAGAWASLMLAREDHDCDGHAQERLDDDGAPTYLGCWPFTGDGK